MLYVVLLHIEISAQIIQSTDIKIAVTLYMYVDCRYCGFMARNIFMSCLSLILTFAFLQQQNRYVVLFLAIPHTSMKFYHFHVLWCT